MTRCTCCKPDPAGSSELLTSSIISNSHFQAEAVKLLSPVRSALTCSVDLDPSQCVHNVPLVASQTQQLHNHISKGDHTQSPRSTAGLGLATVKMWVM